MKLVVDRSIDALSYPVASLEEKRQKLMEEWGIDPVPDEELPPKETLGFRVQRYGMTKWGDLFNSRQKLALITFTEKVRLAYQKMIEEGYDEEYAKAVVGYLGLALSRLIQATANICKWLPQWELMGIAFSMQALPMIWDYFELNPLENIIFGFQRFVSKSCETLSHLSQIPPVEFKEGEK